MWIIVSKEELSRCVAWYGSPAVTEWDCRLTPCLWRILPHWLCFCSLHTPEKKKKKPKHLAPLLFNSPLCSQARSPAAPVCCLFAEQVVCSLLWLKTTLWEQGEWTKTLRLWSDDSAMNSETLYSRAEQQIQVIILTRFFAACTSFIIFTFLSLNSQPDTSPVSHGHTHLQILVQWEVCELVLQVNAEVHILHRVHHDVYELHAGHLETECKVSSLRNI